jgi:hypothetical protein
MAAIDRRFAMQATRTKIAALAVGIALVAGAAQAQSVGPSNGASSLEQLHVALHLSAPQEGAWQLYRSAADIPDKAQMRRRAASGLFRTLDAPHRMDLVEAEMRAELADLQRQSQALKAFYGALSPEQQRIFDARTLPPPGDAQQAQSPY